MTLEVALVLFILLAALVLFITEWIPMDVTALLVLATLAVTGLVDRREAFAGFANPAVVTVWAMFILSEGLTRTGVANRIGQWVMKMAGEGEARLIIVVMLASGGLSAFMNNIGVAAFMMPVGTPANAMIFGTGRVRFEQMLKAGIWVNVGAIVVISLVGIALA